MAYAFPSVDWTNAYKHAINASEGYKKFGKTWNHGAVAMVILAEPSVGIAADTGMLLDVAEGHCRSCTLITGVEADNAPFVIKASYAQWKKVLKKEVDPTKALMQGQLKLTKGHMPTMVKYVSASKELVEATSAVPTLFPDETAPTIAIPVAVLATPVAPKIVQTAPTAQSGIAAPTRETHVATPVAMPGAASAPKAVTQPEATRLSFDNAPPASNSFANMSPDERAREAVAYALRKAADAGEWVLVRDLAQQAEAMSAAQPWPLTALVRLPWVGPIASRFLLAAR